MVWIIRPTASGKFRKIKRDAVVSARREIVLFALAGTAGFVVDAGTVELLHRWADFGLVSAKAVGFALAVTLTWALNRRYAFARGAAPHLLGEWVRYVGTNGVGAVVNNGVYLVAVFSEEAMAAHPALAVALGSLAGMAFNYVAARRWVFYRR